MSKAQSIVGDSEGRPKNEFYPTPPKATNALLRVEQFPQLIWEPACGMLHISKVLESHGHEVINSDLCDYGLGTPQINFLETFQAACPTIITNPPFTLAEKFLTHALNLGVTKIAFLLKLNFLEGQARSYMLETTPLETVWVFRQRLTMTRNGEEMENGGMIAFAWYIWRVGYVGRPQVSWV